MEIVVTEIFSIILFFGVLIGSSFFPFWLLSCRSQPASPVKEHPTSKKKLSREPLLSLCNCFAAGIFIATCFLGIIPNVRENVARYEQAKINKENVSNKIHSNNNPPAADVLHKMNKSMPWTEILLIGGFLLILLIGELIQLCQRCKSKIRRKSSKVVDEFRNDDVEDVEKMNLQDISSPERRCHYLHNLWKYLTDSHNSLDWRSLFLITVLGLHGEFECIALSLQETSGSLSSLMLSVMPHEVLCAVALGINLASHKVNISVAFIAIVMFSLYIPAGMVGGFIIRQRLSSGIWVLDNLHPDILVKFLLVQLIWKGLTASTIIYMVIFDMLNHELSLNKCRLAKILCIIFGFLLLFVLTYFHLNNFVDII